ncbi:MAG: DPP IV N-terminal domain-containing protein [Candidatus Latescibacteria bacterium]|nr:DPP IV N-terminal domain-containing protein [Candidatus Latescibacterota bacterium]
MRRSWCVLVLAAILIIPNVTRAQTEFENMPGYDKYQAMNEAMRGLVTGGAISDSLGRTIIIWAEDGSAAYYVKGEQHYRVNLQNLTIDEISEEDFPEVEQPERRRPRSAGRAKQLTDEPSPDGKWTAYYRDYNVVLVNNETEEEIQVTTTGTERFRYGTACWVYGEELNQGTAMWWSPNSKKLAYYEIDERHCRVFYLTEDHTEVYSTLNSEKYPKAGERNPIAGILIYDLESGIKTRVDVGGDPEQYVYNIRWTPDGSELLFNRTNRHQNVLEVTAADPETGDSRLVVREEQETWQTNSPMMRYLSDGKRFIWETEKTGWRHYELRHLDGRLLNPITKVAEYPCSRIVKVDEEAGYVFYLANSGEFPLNSHLHRVRLNGRSDTRLTSRPLNHTMVNVSPDNRWFIARIEAVDTPPTTALYDSGGREVLILGESDMTRFEEMGLTMPELWSFTAEDGVTTLYGVLFKPANFDPSRKYPLLLSIYGGPGSRGASNTFRAADALCEFGFISVRLDYRGSSGRGKEFLGTGYLKLGIIEIKDHADGIRHIGQRDYIDENRVGIYGHSYGGYMSALALVKFPDVFHAGVAGAPVTDWKNYDTIYTERYMRTPQENPDGYRDGSCLTYAGQLTGKLLILHGLIDDNVHPSNTWQLIEEFQKANVAFDLMIYPESRHGLIRSATALRYEYLIKHLKPEPINP